jgi:hypothetical protein
MIIRIISTILFLLISNICVASLITNVNNIDNSVTVTYQDNSKLEWLQFNQTLDMSINDFLLGTGNTLMADGWSLASNVQMAQLINEAFSVNFQSNEKFQNNAMIDDSLVAAFTSIFTSTFYSVNEGLIQVSFGSDLDNDGGYNLFYTSDNVSPLMQVTFYQDIISVNDKQIIDGLALVRQVNNVPEPSTILLFLLSSIFISVRKNH